MLVKKTGQGGSKIVQGPGNDDVVIKSNSNRDDKHRKSDSYQTQESDKATKQNTYVLSYYNMLIIIRAKIIYE